MKLYKFFVFASVMLILTSTSWASSYKVLKALYSLDGIHPIGALTFDAAGNLYGTASDGGGPFGADGTVFMLTPNANGAWGEKALYVFPPTGNDGEFPHWNPILDNQGNIYGVTSEGGQYRGGTIFKLTPSAQGLWTETLLYQFSGPDGYTPNALFRDAAGNFFGTTVGGGVHGGYYDFGVAFELSPVGAGRYAEQVLHYFTTAGNDGMSPRSNLVQDAAGNFYGTTKGGGLYDKGTVFQLSPSKLGGWHEAVIYSFNGQDGWNPLGGLAIDAAGNIYGTTLYGGTPNNNIGPGNVFELSPSSNGTWTEKGIYTFTYTNNDGQQPMGGIALDSAGNLYGTTYGGGLDRMGTIFEVSPASGQWTETILHSFSGADGADPFCQLILDSSGNLYGTTVYGGVNEAGVVFEVTP